MKSNQTIRQLAYDYHRRKCQLEQVTQQTRNNLEDYINGRFNSLVDVLGSENIIFLDEEVDCDRFIKKLNEEQKLIVSKLHNDSIIFDKNMNLMSRAVHDMMHWTQHFDCDFHGELELFKYQCLKHGNMSDQAKQVMFSEIVLQAAYFTEFGAFAPRQKVILLPIEIIQAI